MLLQIIHDIYFTEQWAPTELLILNIFQNFKDINI